MIAAFQNGTVEVLNRARGRSMFYLISLLFSFWYSVIAYSLRTPVRKSRFTPSLYIPPGSFCVLWPWKVLLLCFIGGWYVGTVVVYDLEDPVEWKEVKRWKGHSGYILNCSFSPNGKYAISFAFSSHCDSLLATSSSDGTVKLWNVNADFKIVQVLHGHQVPHSCLLFPLMLALGLGSCICFQIQLSRQC